MDTFKGQDINTLKKQCAENNFDVVIVPQNLTNKFQPLDLSVKKTAKSFIQNKYNDWFANQVFTQPIHMKAPDKKRLWHRCFPVNWKRS